MQALRFYAAKDLRLEEVDTPRDPGAGQVVVENRFCGICGTDLHEYAYGPIFIPTEPHPFTGAKFPQTLGHEFGGTVTALGEGVTNAKVGDRVSIQPVVSPRAGDYYAERGLFHLSEQLALVGLSWPSGGMSGGALVNDYSIQVIPEEMSDEQAALVEPTAVAVYACDRGQVAAGNSVLVAGAGPIGILTLLAARSAGATQLFVSDVNPTRLQLAEQDVPGVIPINAKNESVGEVTRSHCEGGVGCDVAIECAGNGHALKSALDAVRKQGVIVQTGLHPGENPLNWFDVTFKDVDLRGSWCYPTWYWPRVARLIASGQIPSERAVTRRIKLDEAVEHGFDALLHPAGTELKILIDLAGAA